MDRSKYNYSCRVTSHTQIKFVEQCMFIINAYEDKNGKYFTDWYFEHIYGLNSFEHIFYFNCEAIYIEFILKFG